jgi:3D-(3,5/4)-trihydroxycyclohexane-1,2-dione acylhydrolase (decyclizing)
MSTLRLTAAQATVRFLAAQMTEIDGATMPLFAGAFAIFGHGAVAGGLAAAAGQRGARRLRESAGRPARGRLT